MALGRQWARQAGMLVSWSEMPRSPGHIFYDKLQAVLIAAEFDRFVEDGLPRDMRRVVADPGAIFACCWSARIWSGVRSAGAAMRRCSVRRTRPEPGGAPVNGEAGSVSRIISSSSASLPAPFGPRRLGGAAFLWLARLCRYSVAREAFHA